MLAQTVPFFILKSNRFLLLQPHLCKLSNESVQCVSRTPKLSTRQQPNPSNFTVIPRLTASLRKSLLVLKFPTTKAWLLKTGGQLLCIFYIVTAPYTAVDLFKRHDQKVTEKG